MPGNCHFQDEWLQRSECREWIAKTNNSTQARCVICCKNFDLKSLGWTAVVSHGDGQKHKKRLKDKDRTIGSFFTVSKAASTVTQTCQSGNAAAASLSSQPTSLSRPNTGTISRATSVMDKFVSKNETLSAETFWCLNTVTSHNSYRSCEGTGALFQAMFPDSKIAQAFTCGESKCSRMATYGIAPYFKSLLEKSVCGKDEFVLLFDESLNSQNQKKQLDVLVRFWDGDLVKSRYYGSEFLGHGDADTLAEHFLNCVHNLQLGNLLQISMDGPSVNWKFHRNMVEKIEGEFGKILLEIGSCGLHILHGAFKYAMEKNQYFSVLDDLYSSMYWLFKDSPARREDYQSVTGSSLYPMKFCKHRWLENLPVAERFLAVWDNVKVYVKAVNEKKVTKPQCKSYSVVKDAVANPMIIPMTHFYIATIRELQPFLERYQTDMPMVPFLGNDLFMMMRNLLQRFIKSDVMGGITTPYKVTKLDVKKKDNLCEVRQVNVGAAATEATRKLLSEKTISEVQVYEFRAECQKVLLCLTSRLLEKLPIKYSLVRHMSCLDPRQMVLHRDESVDHMRHLLKVLADKKRIPLEKCDIVGAQYANFLDMTVAKEPSAFKDFNPSKDKEQDRLDTFFHGHLHNQPEYKDLWMVVRMLLILSHGQASVERGFSVNKQVAADNLSEKGFEARRHICDHVAACGGVLNVKMTPQLLAAAASGRQNYLAYLEEQKREKEKQAKSRVKRKLEDDIHDVKQTRKRLREDIESMELKANSLAEEAEKKGKLTLVSQSNSLRRTAAAKRAKLQDTEENLEELLEQFRNC